MNSLHVHVQIQIHFIRPFSLKYIGFLLIKNKKKKKKKINID